jgi:hypothetical protein
LKITWPSAGLAARVLVAGDREHQLGLDRRRQRRPELALGEVVDDVIERRPQVLDGVSDDEA